LVDDARGGDQLIRGIAFEVERPQVLADLKVQGPDDHFGKGLRGSATGKPAPGVYGKC